MARPPLEIDADTVEKLAAIHCTMEEIASVVGCSVDTLERRFADTIKRGKDVGKTSLRRRMWEAAQKGNITMMIWLSKQVLGFADKQELRTPKDSDNTGTGRIITSAEYLAELRARREKA